jgi:hypothetical protein
MRTTRIALLQRHKWLQSISKRLPQPTITGETSNNLVASMKMASEEHVLSKIASTTVSSIPNAAAFPERSGSGKRITILRLEIGERVRAGSRPRHARHRGRIQLPETDRRGPCSEPCLTDFRFDLKSVNCISIF